MDLFDDKPGDPVDLFVDKKFVPVLLKRTVTPPRSLDPAKIKEKQTIPHSLTFEPAPTMSSILSKGGDLDAPLLTAGDGDDGDDNDLSDLSSVASVDDGRASGATRCPATPTPGALATGALAAAGMAASAAAMLATPGAATFLMGGCCCLLGAPLVVANQRRLAKGDGEYIVRGRSRSRRWDECRQRTRAAAAPGVEAGRPCGSDVRDRGRSRRGAPMCMRPRSFSRRPRRSPCRSRSLPGRRTRLPPRWRRWEAHVRCRAFDPEHGNASAVCGSDFFGG